MKSAAHQYEDKLLEFAYGELPQHEADAVDAHVRGCTRCSQSLSEIRGVRATMSQLPLASAPDAGLESLLAYAEQAAKRSSTQAAPSIWKRFLMPLASVMALAVVGVVGFRANKEFDTSPASAIADAKLADMTKAQEKAKEKQQEQALAKTEGEAPPTVAAVAPPTPALSEADGPVDAPKAEPEAAEKNFKQEAKKRAALDDLKEAGGKRGDVWTPEPKGNVPQSVTKRDAAAKTAPVANDEQVYRSQNYSDVGVRGSKLSKDSAPPPPPPAQAQDKVNYGLGSGSPGAAPNEPAPQGGSTGPAVAAKPSPAPKKTPAPARQEEEEAKKESVQQARAEERPAPVAVAPAPQPSAPSTRKSKSGYGILPPSSTSTGSSADLDDALALPQSDTLGVNNDAKFAERQRAEQRTQSLESARVASNRGDRLSEIRLAAQVLEAGATGYQRVEALKRICDAYESLGEPDRADPFCDLLLREFPNTAAAKAVSDRRKQVQRVSPKSPSPVNDRERKALDEAKPAEQAPASSY